MTTLYALSAVTIPGGPVEVGLFVIMALAAIAGALSVILATDPFISALSLILNFAALGTLYLFAGSPFVALAQIIVYAGAVVVLFLFVMAYLGDRREILAEAKTFRSLPAFAGVIAAAFGGVLVYVALDASFPDLPRSFKSTDTQYAYGSAQAIGDLFLTKYTLVFEATSVVLLVAAVGGIVLGLTGRARHRKMRRLLGTRSADQQRRLKAPTREVDPLGSASSAPPAPATEGGGDQ